MPAVKTALITGASSGLGAEFARQLAAMGCNLILVARREDRLHAVRDEILRQHQVKIQIISADLGIADAAQELHGRIVAARMRVDILINNAGFGVFGGHLQIPWQREQQMLMLDIVTLMQLTKLFAQDMRAGSGGYILQLSSIGAYQPTPTYAAYSAAKSFVLNFGEAFNYELRGTNTSCTVLSPGVTATEFLQVAGQRPTLYQRLFMMQSPEVVRIGLRAMFRRKPSVIAGRLNALMVWSNRLLPRRWSAAVAYRLMTLG
jgi:uncharacterized protein